MKTHWNNFTHLILSLPLVMGSSVFTSSAFAQVDTSLAQQQTDCAKNTAMEWSSTSNRCVDKKQAMAARNAVIACSKLTDLTQRQNCNKSIAEQQTGLSADPNSIDQTGGTNKSLIMNGINTAYAALGFINGFGSSKKSSPCMSKKIFGVTAVAGTLSDLYLKNRAKGKVKDLADKYKLDGKSTASASQILAFQYLKDEQNTVADIAGMEKKRNMLLMLGYGASTAMAIYEMTPMGANAACTKPEEKQKDETVKKCDDGSLPVTGVGCPLKDLGEELVCGESSEPDPTNKFCQPKAVVDTSIKCADESTVPQGNNCPIIKTVCGSDETLNSASNTCEKNPVVTPAKDPTPEPAKPTATINATTKMVDGTEKAYYTMADPNDPTKTYDIVDNKVYLKGSTQQIGTLSYSSGAVTPFGSKSSLQPFTVGDVATAPGSNSAFVPSGKFTQLQHDKMKIKI